MLYSYDTIGSYEREKSRVSGSGASLIQPFLDNQARIYAIINFMLKLFGY